MKKSLHYLVISITLLSLISACNNKSKNILIIGDSNGAHQLGWVSQLKKIRVNDQIINYSIGGNTIGFKNLGRDTLNSLKNIETYISNGLKETGTLDYIIVALGTNDCKAVFDSLQYVVIPNLDSLINKVENYNYPRSAAPEIILVSPPPTSPDSLLIPKYYGITQRLENLLPGYSTLSKKHGCIYVDAYTPLKNGFDTLNIDGIHLNEAGSIKLAEIINSKIN